MEQELKEILSSNRDLKERTASESWEISYNKKADMLTMGAEFPKGSFYYPLEDTGVLLRIDKNKKIYGFAIENTKYFIKNNPDVGFVLSLFVYPIRSMFVTFPYYFFVSKTMKGIREIKGILSDYVAGKVAFC